MRAAPTRRLGLGAKFISHSQAAALGIDEQRFQRKLKKKAAAPGGEAGAHAAAVAASAGCAAVAASAGGADESDDDDEDSRASAFALRRGPDSAHTARPKAPAGIAKPAHNLKRRQEPAAKPKQGRRLA